jgi:hypothetical protein
MGVFMSAPVTVMSILAPTGEYGPGALVAVTVNFSGPVTVDASGGTPTLTLSNGATATYVSGSGSNALVFDYIVGAAGSGEITPDLGTVATNALTLNGGTITDGAGAAAVLTGANNVNPPGTLQINDNPPPSHIVVVTLENQNFGDIVGNLAQAPFLNQLISEGMLFTDYYGISHPSQPNYLALFSGSTQGDTDDTVPPQFSSSVPTLASALAANGLSFGGYAETGVDLDHTPWLDFGNSAADGQNFGSFPSNFNNLPGISFVAPNNNDNMHDGTIAAGDAWLASNLGAYAAWAQANNSLLIITFDESGSVPYPNRVATIVVGAGVPAGVTNNQSGDAYSLLATIENLYELAPIGASAGAPLLDFYSATPPTATTSTSTSFSGVSDPKAVAKGNALAVNANNIVSAEGSQYDVSNLSGGAAATASLYTLFAPLGSSQDNNLRYPSSAYDSSTGQFVLIALNSGPSGSGVSTIDIAVSKDSNPADGWSVAALNTALTIGGQPAAADVPSVSVSNGNIYLTAPELFVNTGGNAGTGAWVIGEGSIASGSPTLSASEIADPAAAPYMRGVAGANGVTYYVSARSDGLQGKIALQTYTTSGGFSAMLTLSLGDSDQGHGSNDFSAQQAGTSLALDAGDSRIKGLAYSNGYLYGISEVLPAGAAAPQLHWFKLDVSNPASPQLVAQDEISGTSLGLGTGTAVFNGSIAADAAGDVLINFTASGPSMDPADYYTVMGANSSAFGTPVLYQSSNAPFIQAVGAAGLQSWGPISTAIADPNNPHSFWISNEYVSTTGVNIPSGLSAWWGTATARVQVLGGTTIGSAVNGPVTLTSADNPLTIAKTGSVKSTGGAAGVTGASGVSWNLTNDGTILSSGGTGLSLDGPGDIANSGSISGSDGVALHQGGRIVNLSGGTIADTGVSGAAIYVSGAAGTIVNMGAISDPNHNAVLMTAGGQVTNNPGGSIAGKDNAVFVSGGAGALMNSGSVSASAGTAVDFENGGTATNNAGKTISGGAYGVFVDGVGALTNYGDISGQTSHGVLFTLGGTLTNAAGASISAGNDAIYFRSGATSTVANAGSVTANSGAGVYLAGGGDVSNASAGVIDGAAFAVFISGAPGSLENNGSLKATQYDGVAFGDGGTITNGVGGQIIGGSNAVYISERAAGSVANAGAITGTSPGSAGLDIEGGGTVVNQSGGAVTADAFGVFLTGGLGAVTNDGSITGAHGVSLNGGGSVTNDANAFINGQIAGVAVSGTAGTLKNAGSISAAAAGGAGVDFESGGNVKNLAGGLISGATYGVFVIGGSGTVSNAATASISGGGTGVLMGGGSGSLTNSGAITSAGSAGVDAEGAGNVITNASGGTISGGWAGVYEGGPGTVTNLGSISGGSYAVDFASDSGANLLQVGAGATFTGSVNGDGGAIELLSGAGAIAGISNSGQFWGFQSLNVDAGANWTLNGSGNSIANVTNNGALTIDGSLDVTTGLDAASVGAFDLGAGGVLEVAAAIGAQTAVDFQGASQLAIDNAALFGTGAGGTSYLGSQLENFGAGDSLDIRNFSALGATLAYDPTSGLLQLSNGAELATLDFQQSTLGSGSFQIAADASGRGLLITRS